MTFRVRITLEEMREDIAIDGIVRDMRTTRALTDADAEEIYGVLARQLNAMSGR